MVHWTEQVSVSVTLRWGDYFAEKRLFGKGVMYREDVPNRWKKEELEKI